MDGISIKYKGAEIAQMDASGTKTLKTGGTYCEGDIIVEANVRSGTHNLHIEYNNPTSVSGAGSYVTILTADPLMKRIRSYASLMVRYRCTGTAGCLFSGIMGNGILTPGWEDPSAMGYVNSGRAYRLTADGVGTYGGVIHGLIDGSKSDVVLTSGSGRVYITPEGDLRLYGNTNAYPILPGLITMDLLWTDEIEQPGGGGSEPTYTNQIPISTDTDGSIYNDIGYILDKRITSAGAISDMSGYFVTGFIPFTPGDTIQISKFCKDANHANACRVAFFTSSHQMIASESAGQLYMQGHTYDTLFEWTPGTEIDDIGTGKKKSIASAAYIRLCIGGYNDTAANIICTINEEIK